MFIAPLPSADQSALPAALHWMESLLLGSIGAAVAVVAVALIGFALLTGRVSIRKGARVVLGCFILFGAGGIARGLLGLAEVQAPVIIAYQTSAPIPAPTPSRTINPFDPYAGAAVPMGH